MKSTAQAQAQARELAEKLAKRFAGSSTIDTVRVANDANGWPMIFCSDGGTETAGAALVVIRISNPDAVSKDIFGNATSAYTPHNLEFAYELTAANNPIPADTDLFKAFWEATKTGIKTQVKEIANGTAVDATSMDAKSADCELDELYWPLKSI
jgi:hypothetical protein